MNPYRLNEEQDSIPVGQPITYPQNPYAPSNNQQHTTINNKNAQRYLPVQVVQGVPHQQLRPAPLPQSYPVDPIGFYAQQQGMTMTQANLQGCPFCRSTRPPVQLKVPGKVTVGWAVLLCMCCWPAMWAPFCVDGCLDTHLACPDCKNVVSRQEAKCCPS